MNNELMNKTCAAMTSNYHEAFWKAMHGSELAYGEMDQAKISANGGTYLLPAKTASRFSAALKNTNLFRQISTVMAGPVGDGMFWMGDMDDQPQWVPENDPIPTGNDTLGPKERVRSHKLAIITSLELDIVNEAAFDLEGYLLSGSLQKASARPRRMPSSTGPAAICRRESCTITMGPRPASPSPGKSPLMMCWGCTSPWISVIAATACG